MAWIGIVAIVLVVFVLIFMFLLNRGGDMRKHSDYIAMIEDEDQVKAVKKILKTEGKST